MNHSRTSIVMLALACVGLLVGCNSGPTTPDVAVTPPETSALTVGPSGTLTSGESLNNRGDGALGVVYVRSQNLYYDTFVTAERLPPHGPFQLLVDGVTEYGPGDRHYVGGRWKVPKDGGGYDYFLCPLLGPGRDEP